LRPGPAPPPGRAKDVVAGAARFALALLLQWHERAGMAAAPYLIAPVTPLLRA